MMAECAKVSQVSAFFDITLAQKCLIFHTVVECACAKVPHLHCNVLDSVEADGSGRKNTCDDDTFWMNQIILLTLRS